MFILERLRTLPHLRWWVLLVGLAIAVQTIWVTFAGRRAPYLDEVHYISHAQALAEGRGYVDEAGQPTAYWPVGYPALLSLAYRLGGTNAVTAFALQIALSTATCVLVSLVGSMALGSDVGRLAAVCLAIYPTHVFYATLYLTEPLFTLLTVAAMLLLLKAIRQPLWFAPAGIVLGLAVLVRPVILLFPLTLPVWFLLMRRSFWRALQATALAGGCSFLAITPWLVRNHGLTGSWLVISTTGGTNFWVGNYPGAFGGAARPLEITEQLRVGSHYDYSRGYRLGLAAIRRFPLRSALRELQKVTYFFALETDGVLWNLKGFRPREPLWIALGLLALANTAYLLLIALTVLALLDTRREDPLASLFLILTSYLVVVSMVFIGDPRYHYALVPLAAIFLAKALLQDAPALWQAVKRNDPRGRRLVGILGAVCAVFMLLMVANLGLKVLESRALGVSLTP